MNVKRTLAMLVVALVLAACGGGAANTTTGSMTDAAKQFIEAVFKGDKVKGAEVICAAQKAAADAMFAAAGNLPAGAELDTSGLTYTVKSESGDTGEVTVGGKLKITAAGVSQEMDMSAMGGALTALPMKNESGWKVCVSVP
jgi:hypothetical protein